MRTLTLQGVRFSPSIVGRILVVLVRPVPGACWELHATNSRNELWRVAFKLPRFNQPHPRTLVLPRDCVSQTTGQQQYVCFITVHAFTGSLAATLHVRDPWDHSFWLDVDIPPSVWRGHVDGGSHPACATRSPARLEGLDPDSPRIHDGHLARWGAVSRPVPCSARRAGRRG
jgi:hypothetical protein